MPTVPTPRVLFVEFARMGLSGFGGVLPFVRRSVVDRNGWLTDQEFVELVSVGQVLPGPNVINFAVMLGLRFSGLLGALSAFSGLVFMPMLVVLMLGLLYGHYQELAIAQRMLAGMTAVAAGLIVAMSVRLALSQPRNVRSPFCGIVAFGAIGLLHWPLLAVMAVLVPLALTLEWRTLRGSTR